jgi:hypothetical protein
MDENSLCGKAVGTVAGPGVFHFPGDWKLPVFPILNGLRFEDFTGPSMLGRQQTGLRSLPDLWLGAVQSIVVRSFNERDLGQQLGVRLSRSETPRPNCDPVSPSQNQSDFVHREDTRGKLLGTADHERNPRARGRLPF